MSEIQLPKLKIIDVNKPKKPKVLLLSDDLQLFSGIATMSREFVINTADQIDWVQLGAAQEHPNHGKVFDLSPAVNDYLGVDDAYVKVYCHSGYGNESVIRELMAIERPDAILHFTDPRYWEWLYLMEHEIHTKFKVPIMYYNIWDCPPAPRWNKPFYRSCDLIMNITKQTQNLVKLVLERDNYVDLDSNEEFESGKSNICYVPHGIPEQIYFPIPDSKEILPNNEYATDKVIEEYHKFVDNFKKKHGVEFVVFWNNRNAARKHPGDVILSYRAFCDLLPKEFSKKCALVMHTDVIDPNGTNLMEVKDNICPDYKVIFHEEKVGVDQLNFFYNMADVTLNIASNEGFGLSNAESMMAGTLVIANVTGGLQDQMRFEDENGNWITFEGEFTSNHTGRYTKHGSWVFPVYPACRSLQGSIATPYIFDDRVRFEDVAHQLMNVFNLKREDRKILGLKGREWLMTEESGMTAKNMSKKMAKHILNCLNRWNSPEDIRFSEIVPKTPHKESIGIVF